MYSTYIHTGHWLLKCIDDSTKIGAGTSVFCQFSTYKAEERDIIEVDICQLFCIFWKKSG